MAKPLVGVFWVILWGSVCGGAVYAQEGDPVELLYQRSMQAIELADQPLEELNSRYVEELEKLKLKIQKKGDLETALKIQDEIKKHKGAEFDTALKAVPELRRLREIYDSNRVRIKADVRQKQLAIMKDAAQKFSAFKTDLTKQGDLQRALKAEEYRQEMAALAARSATPSSVPRIAEVESEYQFVPFSVGEKLFSNRPYQWKSVPKDFSGYAVSLAAGGSKRKTVFRVTLPGLVTIIAGIDDCDPLISDGWKKVGEAVRPPGDATAYVLQKELSKGKQEFATPLTFIGVRLLQAPTPDAD